MHCPSLGSLLLVSSLALAQPVHEVPSGWELILASPRPFTIRLDHSNATSGGSSVLISQDGSSTSGFAVLMQAVEAAPYRGKRVRFSGELRTQEVKAWAGLWFRAVDASGRTLAFDSMEGKERRLPGDTDWQRRDIVIDIPVDAAKVLYGVTLNGTGRFWADGLELEVVDQSLPVTATGPARKGDPYQAPRTLPSPSNLDFEL